MKVKDFDLSIDVLDAEQTTIMERLAGLDPTSDEYRKAADSLKSVAETEQIKIRNRNDHVAGKIPPWAVGIFGTVVGVLFGGVVLREEREGGVVSSQAINFWDKVVRKF